MPLQEADVLDAISVNPDGRPNLVIRDDGLWDDDDLRWSCLLDKLKSYIGYIHSDDFAAEYPGVAPREVTVEVVCRQPPSPRMAALTSFAPRGDEANRIALTCTPVTEIDAMLRNQAKGDGPAGPAANRSRKASE